MRLTIDHAQGRVPVTILALHGSLDASNFETVIAQARDLYQAGIRYLLLDLRDMAFMGSSGLVALHSIALLMRGQTPPNPEDGWQAFHALGHDRSGDAQPNVKLLGPQPKVERTLQVTSMHTFFEVFTDLQAAVDSF